MPRLGREDAFEQKYMARFKELAAPHGLIVTYERDRAILDLGLHLTAPAGNGSHLVTDRRVWFQMKGIQRETLTAEQFKELDEVPLDLKVEDLKFWYASPEVVYIVAYYECVDRFLAEDIRDIVDREWGPSALSERTLPAAQKTARVRLLKTAELDDRCWHEMARHRSMRIDGPLFRGRPLGHRLDPLRCTLSPMEPAAFSAMIGRLLDVHGFRKSRQLDARQIFPNPCSGDEADLFLGCMYHTFEWIWHMSTELIPDQGSHFRTEGRPHFVQGSCAVLLHSRRCTYPDSGGLRALATQLLHDESVKELLVFTNDSPPPKYIGSFRGAVTDMGLSCMPQTLSDIPYVLLTSTAVYLEFREKIEWRFVQYLQ